MQRNSTSLNAHWTSFKLSKPVVVVYEDDDMKVKVEKVLSHIVWLLEEVQKADELEDGNKRIKVD